MTTESAASTDAEETGRLVALAWRAVAEGPASLPPHIAQLNRRAGDPLAERMAALFEARLCLFNDDRSGCESALARAERALPPAWHDAASAQEWAVACAEMRAVLMARDGAWSESRALLRPLLQQLGSLRTPTLRFLLLTRQALVLERLGDFDEALTQHYARLAEARAIGSPWLLALTLATLGGLQSSLLNLDDARPLCEEAWALCRDDPARAAVACTAGPNLMMVLSGLGRHDEAAALARHLLAQEARYPANQRAQRLCLYAAALQRAGQEATSQACLDQCAAVDGEGGRRSEWVWTQAALWNGQGRAREALHLLQHHLAAGAERPEGADYPIDAIELHHHAARASEALGDLRGALHHERLAGAAREQALERAGRARHVTLQVRHDLAAAQQQRDQAQHEQARLAELNARLHEANQAKVRFLAAASHDLRQPLHALALRAAALRLELQTPRQRELLASIEHCAGTMGTMFDALLDLSRAETGVLQPQRAAFDLRGLLLRLIEEHRPIAEAQGLGLALRLARRVPAFADSDPRLLETLLRNLLGNATKYNTPRGAVLLCARLGYGPGGAHWRLQVRDSGIGIAAERQAQVFEEFYQVDNPARRREQGQGLGLAIAQRLAGLLAHPLSLRSAPGRGSCFEVRVPVAPPSPSAASTGTPGASVGGEAQHEPPVVPTPPRFDLHVAVIEDDPEVQRALRAWLEASGCRVSLGLDADEVMAAARATGRIDAVLADLRLPGARDGAAEVARLREQVGRVVPALILTGDLAEDSMRDPPSEAAPRLDTLGLPWLRKPVEVARLAAWLAGIAPA
jgi:signal transduction histidine kinase